MTINEYQTEALRTAAGMNHPNNDEILLNGVMGLCGESGECVDMVKKYRFQGHELDKAHLAKELGDVARYLAVTAYCSKWVWSLSSTPYLNFFSRRSASAMTYCWMPRFGTDDGTVMVCAFIRFCPLTL